MKLVPDQNPSHGRLVLLAPPDAEIPGSFARVETSSSDHVRFLHGVQRLRAKLYTDDGAIRESDVSPDGRHWHPSDECAWHVLSLGEDGEIRGCSRYFAHPNTVAFRQLGVRMAALAHSEEWGLTLRLAVDSEIAQARRRGLAYVEVGGWALEPAMRFTAGAVRIALATYSLARVLGGGIGITTATRRHCSAAILRKIGGRPLRLDQVELPPYYDPQYDCDMELLRFDSAEPNPRFEPWIEDMRQYLTAALVVQPKAQPEAMAEESLVNLAFAAQGSPRRQAPRARESWRFGQSPVPAVQ